MKDKAHCWWHLRFEILGLILIIIATILTIISLNSFGIGVMFIVGGALCVFKHWCCHHGHICHPECDEEHEGMVHAEEISSVAPKSSVKKTPKM